MQASTYFILLYNLYSEQRERWSSDKLGKLPIYLNSSLKSTTFKKTINVEQILFFNFIFILHYSVVYLQCYVSFMCTEKWFSYTYADIHSFSYFFPIYFIIEYWVEFPVPHSRSLNSRSLPQQNFLEDPHMPITLFSYLGRYKY